MKKLIVAALIVLCGCGYARSRVSVEVAYGRPVCYARTGCSTYNYRSPPVYYYSSYYRPAPIVIYRDRYYTDYGRFRSHSRRCR